eukprot:TRINITY_DN19606_c0_g1_i1.p1 TRINITY_DN19606_c0_g1~~TRINITY_DN19606_c0_g1_i1.p1  ORF type:complete len:224 (-),score=19.87 TRINITY_DN19606_c0_g1_i1:383-1054(-)
MPKSAFESHVYQHPWSEISYAVWRKYPNPSRPDVLSIDILDRNLDPETGILRTRRMVTMKGPLPSWMERIIGRTSVCHFIEDSEINPKTQTMTLKSRNVTLEQVILMEESCSYTAHENGAWTKMGLEGKVTSFSFGVASRIEDFLTGMFKQNAHKGRDIMEQACAKIKQETAEKIAAAEVFGRNIKLEAEEFGRNIKQEAEDGLAAVVDTTRRERNGLMTALD